MATAVAWRDVVLGGATGHRITSVEGWEALPPTRYDKQARARGHGAHSSPVWADERIVTVTGTAHSPDDRDALLAELQDGMWLSEEQDGEEPLTITVAGRTLTSSAQLLRYDPVVATGSYNVGLVKWVAQWRCPDPLRYGPTRLASTGLPTGGGGLAYPLAYPTRYGEVGQLGQLLLDNDGTAPAPIVFTVLGDLPAGFEISALGRRITYATGVPAGQLISVDTDTGVVLAEGTASRRGELTYADWLTVPARGLLTVQFTSLGGTYDPTAQLTARWGDTYW